MSRIDEIEKIIEQLPPEDFVKLSLWMEQRRLIKLASKDYPTEVQSTSALRDHAAFLDGYAPEDGGIYDDAAGR